MPRRATRRPTSSGPPKPAGPPDGKDALFEGAFKKYSDKDYAGARSWFASFV